MEQLKLIPDPEPCPYWGCRHGCVCGGRGLAELRERERATSDHEAEPTVGAPRETPSRGVPYNEFPPGY